MEAGKRRIDAEDAEAMFYFDLYRLYALMEQYDYIA